MIGRVFAARGRALTLSGKLLSSIGAEALKNEGGRQKVERALVSQLNYMEDKSFLTGFVLEIGQVKRSKRP